MKRVLKSAFAVTIIAVLTVLSVFSCFAKGTCMLDNEVCVGYKDTFTYTLYLSDCEKPIADMVGHIFYDSKYLKLDEDSVTFHDLMGVSRNLGLDGHIPFTFSALSDPVDFSERTPVVSLDFKVLREGKTSVKYFISDMDWGDVESNQPIKNYEFTCDYVVHSTDGDESYKKLTPVLINDRDMMNEYQGSFINYSDGKGEQSAKDKDKGDNEHIAVTGESQGDVIDVKKGDGESAGTPTIAITIAVIVIVLVIAAIVILRRVTNKSSDDVTDENEEEPEE